ncbi:hypothetical protein HYW87_03565 [Candidatus Roizmanbacteria bacterium]|nr:hypothetical protein [Candidatus Roizmanbacteria bacterium]
METVRVNKIPMKDAIKANLASHVSKEIITTPSDLLEKLFLQEEHIIIDNIKPFNPILLTLAPKSERYDFQEFAEIGTARIDNATTTPVIPGDAKMAVMHPAQLIAFVCDKLPKQKIREIIRQWKRSITKYDEKIGMELKRRSKSPHIIITLEIKGEKISIPAYLAYLDKTDDMPNLDSLSLSQGLLNFLKERGVDLLDVQTEATILDFSVPRMPSLTDDYTF